MRHSSRFSASPPLATSRAGAASMAVHFVEVRLDQEGDAFQHRAALLQVRALADEARLEVRPPERRGKAGDAVQEERRVIVGERRAVQQGEQPVASPSPGAARARRARRPRR